MRSIALVSMEGSIDFFCFPNFDSPTVFAALLDNERGGSFCIWAELENQRSRQLYLPDTNILLTRFLSDSGVAEITDFMPILAGKKGEIYAHQIIRMVRVIKGEIQFRMRCAPRFNYARNRAYRARRAGQHPLRARLRLVPANDSARQRSHCARRRRCRRHLHAQGGRDRHLHLRRRALAVQKFSIPKLSKIISIKPRTTGANGSRVPTTPAAGARWSTAPLWS